MKATISITIVLLCTAALTACSSESKFEPVAHSNVQKQEAQTIKSMPLNPSASTAVNANDKMFIQDVENSIDTLQKTLKELDLILSETQHNDELDEAKESVDIARQEVLYLWNKIHNDSKPESANLKKIKTSYEGILTKFRKGLTYQLDGMRVVNSVKIMEGIDITNKAKSSLNELVMNIKKEKG
ncbi:hypothetical protein [Aneurinibacillus tyrosinisolvens]|uniref:hypothetical protein n=1 Tax=Aneurinibacillus tyrosinisolvens TaxID=1443435 RepID=UPI00063F3C37|nr:hypothetical protein [Aneurinibacillus tyrosinisolvens]